MPKLDKWIVATRMAEPIDPATMRQILDLGGVIGGGWCQVHQHILVNAENKEKIETLLRDQGLEVLPADDHSLRHPDAEAHHG